MGLKTKSILAVNAIVIVACVPPYVDKLGLIVAFAASVAAPFKYLLS